jgi:hypothetical protein
MLPADASLDPTAKFDASRPTILIETERLHVLRTTEAELL